MFSENLVSSLQATLGEIESAGLYKRERLIDSTQNSTVRLKAKPREADAAGARFRLVTTDGVFSTDGIIAQPDKVHELAANSG